MTIVFITDRKDVVYQNYEINEPESNLLFWKLIIYKSFNKLKTQIEEVEEHDTKDTEEAQRCKEEGDNFLIPFEGDNGRKGEGSI